VDIGAFEILLAILGISILVIVHESGHYLAARAFGMRVETYSIGFGPTIFKYQPKNSPTTFKVAAIPFLAYVQIAGMNPHEEVEKDDPGLFPNKSLFARITTIAAGPIANYLMASILIFILGLGGWPQSWLRLLSPDDARLGPHTPMTVSEVMPDSPAEVGGLESGDVILAANGEDVAHVGELIQRLQEREAYDGKRVTVRVERDGQERTLEIAPGKTGSGARVLGVAAEPPPPVSFSVGEAFTSSFVFPWRLTMLQLEGIGRMITRFETKQIGGPVKMVEMVGSAAHHGPLSYFGMLVLLSVALGMFNLLPFPALDGGRLMFLAYEVVTRRRPNEKFEAMVHTVGIVFLLVVILLVTVRDIRYFGGDESEEASQQEQREQRDPPAESPSSMVSAMIAAPAE